MTSFVVLVVTFLLVMVAIGVHYELFRFLTSTMARVRIAARMKVALVIFAAVICHSVEALLFAGGTGLLIFWDCGGLVGAEGTPLDLIYFSFATYTTLGFGDIVATGPLRLLVGIEGITGLVLIAWTASFAYFEMQRYWGENSEGP